MAYPDRWECMSDAGVFKILTMRIHDIIKEALIDYVSLITLNEQFKKMPVEDKIDFVITKNKKLNKILKAEQHDL